MVLSCLLYLTPVPPELPSIEGHVNGSNVKVPHKQESLSMTCNSDRGKPAAVITWWRNDEEIKDGIVYTKESSGDKLENAKSVLTFKPQSDDNDALFSCKATNGALTSPLETTVQLSVMRKSKYRIACLNIAKKNTLLHTS